MAKPRFSPHARKALGRTALVVAVMLIASYVLSRNLLGPLGVLIKGPQEASLDRLARVVDDWPSPLPVRGFPRVVLVELDRETVQRLSPGGYVFHRGQTARIAQKLMEYRPAGVFFDLDLSQPANEGGELSAGDRRLLEVMKGASAPVLLPDDTLLGAPLAAVSPNLHPALAQVLYDPDGQTRRIPRPEPGRPLAASLGLYCLGLGLDPHDPGGCARLVSPGGADGKRVVYREVRRFGPGAEGQQLWPGLTVIGGAEFLDGGLVNSPETQGALFVVGRTYPEPDDLHFTPVGAVQGVDIHVNALLTLATYRSFSETLGWGPVLLVVPLAVFLALWLVYAVVDGRLKKSRFQGFVRALVETAVAAWFLFFAGVAILQYSGYYLDYLYPVVAFQTGALLLGLWAGRRKDEKVRGDRGEETGEKLKEVVEGTGG